MRLKIATTALLIFGLALALMWPVFVGPVPAEKPLPKGTEVEVRRAEAENMRAKREYLARSGVYLMVLLLDFFATAVLAALVARRTRAEYRDEAMANMRILLEGTIEAHRRRSGGDQQD